MNRAYVSTALERFDEARGTLRESIHISAGMDDPTGLTAAIEDFAELAKLEGRLDLSVRICAACDILRRDRHAPRRPIDEERVEKERLEVRGMLGDAAYEVADTVHSFDTLQPVG